MKIKIYRKHSGLFYVFIEGNDGWYKTYNRYFTNPNQVSHKLKKKKLSKKYITKLFKCLRVEYDEIGLDQCIKADNMTYIVSYENKNIS
jgi:hypothetical protein